MWDRYGDGDVGGGGNGLKTTGSRGLKDTISPKLKLLWTPGVFTWLSSVPLHDESIRIHENSGFKTPRVIYTGLFAMILNISQLARRQIKFQDKFRTWKLFYASFISPMVFPLQWRNNGRTGVSIHQPHDCLLKRLFRCKPKKTPKLRVAGPFFFFFWGGGGGIHRWPMNCRLTYWLMWWICSYSSGLYYRHWIH